MTSERGVKTPETTGSGQDLATLGARFVALFIDWIACTVLAIGLLVGPVRAFVRRRLAARRARPVGWVAVTDARLDHLGSRAGLPRRPDQSATAYATALAERLYSLSGHRIGVPGRYSPTRTRVASSSEPANTRSHSANTTRDWRGRVATLPTRVSRRSTPRGV